MDDDGPTQDRRVDLEKVLVHVQLDDVLLQLHRQAGVLARRPDDVQATPPVVTAAEKT
jgi:hypothetical protein